MAIEVDTVEMPVYWASALVNGDLSGLDPEDRAACRAETRALADDGWFVVVSADGDEFFSWSTTLPSGADFAGTLTSYTVHRVVSEPAG